MPLLLQFQVVVSILCIRRILGEGVLQGCSGIGLVAEARSEDGLQILCGSIGILDVLQRVSGCGIVLVQDLGQGSAVRANLAEVLLCLGEVTLGEVQVADDLRDAVGTRSTGDVLLSICEVAALQGQQSEVGLGLCQAAVST